MGKSTSADDMIGGSDGPTAVAVIKKNPKLTLQQKFGKCRYKIKKAYVERTIKTNSHSLDEVIEYMVNHHGFTELDHDEVYQEYNEMRASFILQYMPELLGEYSTMPSLRSESPEDILAHLKHFHERQQRALEIPIDKFDIDFHKFQLALDDPNNDIYITIEKRFAYIGGGASGSKKTVKRFQHIYKDVYRYYGVTKEDIKNKSKRYEEVIRALTR